MALWVVLGAETPCVSEKILGVVRTSELACLEAGDGYYCGFSGPFSSPWGRRGSNIEGGCEENCLSKEQVWGESPVGTHIEPGLQGCHPGNSLAWAFLHGIRDGRGRN